MVKAAEFLKNDAAPWVPQMAVKKKKNQVLPTPLILADLGGSEKNTPEVH